MSVQEQPSVEPKPEDAAGTQSKVEAVTGAQPEVEGPPLVEPTPQDTTLVVHVTRSANSVLKWLTALAEDEFLSRFPLIIAYTDRGIDILGEIAEIVPAARLLSLPDDATEDGSGTTDAFADVYRSVATPYFALSYVPRRVKDSLIKLRHEMATGLALINAVGLEAKAPLQLYTRQVRNTPIRTYLHYMLERFPAPQPPLRDYLGYLALKSGTLSLEGLDALHEGGKVKLQGRASIGRYNSASPHPWHYKFIVTDRSQTPYATAAAEQWQRVSNTGIKRWENLEADIDLEPVPDGNHLIMLALDTDYEPLKIRKALRPRPGVLACARTHFLSDRQAGVHIRYLVHTIRRTPQTWITIQHGVGRAAKKQWYRTLAKKDLRHLLRDRAAGRIRLARLVRLLTQPLMKKKRIWLVGEREDTAQDNGIHLFRYLRKTYPKAPIYYVIDRDSPQYERVAPLGNVVAHSSIKHRFLMTHASVLANAYSIKHMIPKQWSSSAYTRFLAWRVGALRVYLKHGVNVSANSVKRGTGGYDLYLSVNDRETEALRSSSGYNDQIVETGMPRYDALEPGPKTRTILFMPTWRRYLVPKLFGDSDEALVEFDGSTYQQFLTGFLASPRLDEMLRKYDYRLNFLPHYNLKQLLAGFELTSDRTAFADTITNTFQDVLRGCDGLITDHSSVHFDVAYLGTPIIYAHFDKDEYAAGHASTSWFEHERDGFGPVTYTLDETLDALEELLARDCAPDPFYTARTDAAFAYRDHNNCQRVVAAVNEALERNAVNP